MTYNQCCDVEWKQATIGVTLVRASIVVVLIVVQIGCTPSYPHNADLDKELAEQSRSDGLGIITTAPTFGTLPLTYFDGHGEQVRCCGKLRQTWAVSGGRQLFAIDTSSFILHPTAPELWEPNAFLFDVSGSELRRFPFWIRASFVAFSSDGKMIAFAGVAGSPQNRASRPVSGIAFGPLDGTAFREIYRTSQVTIGGEEPPHTLAWSPGGTEITYGRDGNVLVYDLLTGHSRPLANGSNPLWSPDGKWISYRGPNGEAMLIEPSGEHRTVLLRGQRITQAMYWSPDSRYLLTNLLVNYDGLLWAQPIVYRLRDGATTAAGEPLRGWANSAQDWVVTGKHL